MAGSARDTVCGLSPMAKDDAVTVVVTRRRLAMDTGDEGVSRGDTDLSCPSPYSTPVVPPGKEAHSNEPSPPLSPDATEFFSPAQSTPPDTNSPIDPSNNMWPGFAATATTENAAADSPTLFPPTRGPIHVNTPDAPLTSSSLPAAGDTAAGAVGEGGSKAGDTQQQRQAPPLTPQGGTASGAGGRGRGRGGLDRGIGGGADVPPATPARFSTRLAQKAMAEAGAIQTATARDSPPTTRGARLPHA